MRNEIVKLITKASIIPNHEFQVIIITVKIHLTIKTFRLKSGYFLV